MPATQTTDPQQQLDRLQQAVSRRDRWVFITDSLQAHLCMAALAMMLVNTGVGESLEYAMTDFVNIKTHWRRVISYLTIPKSGVGREELGILMRAAGIPFAGFDGEQDLILLPAGGSERELAGLAETLNRGQIHLQRADQN